MSVNEKMTALANEVRRLSGAEGKLGIEAMTEKLAGVEVGGGESTDALWDAILNNGERKNYEKSFEGAYWTNDVFKPNHDIKPTSAKYMFNNFDKLNANPSTYMDLVERLNSLGISLDTSECTNCEGMFNAAKISRVGIIDLRKATTTSAAFYNFQGHTVDKVILPTTTSYLSDTAFAWATKLKNIELEGVIGKKISFGYCPLTKQSMTNVINALSDTTTGLSVAFHINVVNREFETATGLKDGSTSQEWLGLIATKPNWTINLENPSGSNLT